MDKRRIINVDIDGVLYPFNEAMASWLRGQGKKHLFPSPTTWEYWYEWNMTQGEWERQFRTGVEDGIIWRYGKPFEDAVDAMWRLSDAEWHIRLVTHRLNHKWGYQQAVTSTVDWLRQYSIPYRSLAFASDSKSNYKAEYLLDDNFNNVKSFAKKYDETTAQMGILIARTWNKEANWAPRVSLAEAVSTIIAGRPF